MANRGEKVEAVTDFIFLGSKITAGGDCRHEINILGSWKESYDQPRQCITKQRHCMANKGPHSQSYAFSSIHIQIWELIHKEGWALKNRCFQIVVLEKTIKSPVDCKEIKPVNPKGNQSWIIIGRIVAEAPKLWPPDVKSKLAAKTLIPGKIEGTRITGQQTMR